jgi:hypothetical protein
VHGILGFKYVLKVMDESGFYVGRIIVGSTLGVTNLIDIVSSPSLIGFLMEKGGVFVTMF